MEKNMNITAKDGKSGFETAEECIAYEKALEEKEREERENELIINAEKKKEYQEIIKLCEELFDKTREYEEKYRVRLLSSEIFYPFYPQLLPSGFKFRKLFL